jgi:hypothetical protein
MGLDLQLLPFDFDGTFAYSHTVLSCMRRDDLFEEIAKLKVGDGQVVPPKFMTYVSREAGRDSHYGVTQTTPYGKMLCYVTVKDLLTFSKHVDVTDNHKNKAIWAYLRQLPKSTKVALYWN